MEWRFALADGAGTLLVREDGGTALLTGELPDDRRGLYKGWLTGEGGGRVLLGTFLPEQGMLRLHRRAPVSELRKKGAWPPAGARAELVYPSQNGRHRENTPLPPGWERAGEPGRFLGDPLLKRSAQGLKGILVRRRAEGVELAIPFSAGGALALTPLVCLMAPRQLGGQSYLCVQLDKKGWPIRPGADNPNAKRAD